MKEEHSQIAENFVAPMLLQISFNKLFEHYKLLVEHKDEFVSAKAKRILKIAEENPILRDGFSDYTLLEKYKEEIEFILQDSFSPVLTHNEIKSASLPFYDLIFNSSERFKKIIERAGDSFDLSIKNLPENEKYISACTVILMICYGYNINLKRPFYYQIPDENGIDRFYKILYNADFVEVIPTENAKEITQEDYEELLDNYENIDLWKEKFPPNSYIFKGFVISNIFDITQDQSISNIKSNLIVENRSDQEGFTENLRKVFSSLFELQDIDIGFSIYNPEEDRFEKVYGVEMNSFLLNGSDYKHCNSALCSWSYKHLLKDKKFYTVSDVDKYYKLSNGNRPQYEALKEQGIKSAILAPIGDENQLLGILEIVSKNRGELNSINANKLNDVMPFIVEALKRSKKEEENLIEAIIQKECTSIHPSVHWRFQEEAMNYIMDEMAGNEPSFNKIAFEDIYPLYGQIDIKGSSEARNWATKQDLILQLNKAKQILQNASNIEELPIYEQYVYQINEYLNDLENNFQVDSEQQIMAFFRKDVTSIFDHLKKSNLLASEIGEYLNLIDSKANSVYQHRKDYDKTIAKINKEMAGLLDHKQIEAQKMYPHYFERFKTDGVEHNMYIGESITKKNSFSPIYLYNLRLWQLQVMCEMENAYYQKQHKFPVKLDVASMILVFNQPLSISFRMDEKQFDVDGTYNARYEIVKKRVDKAYIKGTKERVTSKGKISIIYSQKQDELEYLRYIKFLQSKRYLDDDVEIVELQDLQAVTGLKAIRVSVLYNKKKSDKSFYTYDDLMKEINA